MSPKEIAEVTGTKVHNVYVYMELMILMGSVAFNGLEKYSTTTKRLSVKKYINQKFGK